MLRPTNSQKTLAAAVLSLVVCLVLPSALPAAEVIDTILIPSPESPLVSVRLMFRVGSIHDPEGKEGLTALTGLMMGQSGTRSRSYADLVDALYPMAASFEVNTDREVTVIHGEVHRDNFDAFADLLAEAVTTPGFSTSDFERHREQLSSYLTTTLRATNDELLGLEMMQQVLFEDHPYGHSPAGTVAGLANITLEDVKAHYGKHFTESNLAVGMAGGFNDEQRERFLGKLNRLPSGQPSVVELPEPAAIEGRNFTLVAKVTDSVGIHLGYPLPINRSHPDYFPLMLANSFLGEHRTFHGRLMQQLRGKRGLNYGDYSYIEYYELPPFTNTPTPGVPRRQQYFSVWIRPVVPDTAHFALRNALHEVQRLVEQGMTAEEFELTRDYLVNYSKLWAQTMAERLGFMMDSHFYGTEYFIDEIDARLKVLTLEQVNAAVKKYIRADDYRAVFVTNNAADVKAYLESDEPSPMTYNASPGDDVLEADKTIEKLVVEPSSIEIVEVGTLFE